MKLNKLEFLFVKNVIRNFLQKFYEFPKIKKLVNIQRGSKILEVGCGTGYGASLIKAFYQPKEFFAIDLDPKMIEISKKRRKAKGISFRVASATKLPFKGTQFDAVFEFTAFHHIRGWKKAIEEVHRVLKSKGVFVIEDLSRETFETLLGRHFRKHFIHPYQTMFCIDELVSELKKIGFEVKTVKSFFPFHVLKIFFVVAEKK